MPSMKSNDQTIVAELDQIGAQYNQWVLVDSQGITSFHSSRSQFLQVAV